MPCSASNKTQLLNLFYREQITIIFFPLATYYLLLIVLSSTCYLLNTQQTNIHEVRRFRTCDSFNQAAADLRLRPHGHRIRQICTHSCDVINLWLQILWGFEPSWMWHCTVWKTDTGFRKNVVPPFQGRIINLNRWFYFISLHYFSSFLYHCILFFIFSLTHSFLYPLPTLPCYHHSLSVHAAAILILPPNVRKNHFIF